MSIEHSNMTWPPVGKPAKPCTRGTTKTTPSEASDAAWSKRCKETGQWSKVEPNRQDTVECGEGFDPLGLNR